MQAARILKMARKRAGLTQRQLAERSGIKQPAIARIESQRVIPRTDTLNRLLAACGVDLEPQKRLGEGVDRSQIRELLRLTPLQRIEHAIAASRNVERFMGSIKKSK